MSKFSFSSSNLSKYVITYPRFNMSYLVTLELQKFAKLAQKITGKEMKLVADDKKERVYEIVVDAANREGCDIPRDYNQYIIAPVGTKLFVRGGRPYSVAAGVKKLCKLLKAGKPITETIIGDYEADLKKIGNDYRLTWGDDFDGDEVDTSKWDIYYGRKVCYANGCNGKITNRFREDKPNFYLKDGSFYICADQTEDAYYGGMLCTNGIMRYKYGFIEISTIHPKGLGFWTSLWLLSSPGPDGYFTEIDVDECYGDGGDWCFGNSFTTPTAEAKQKGGRIYMLNNHCHADTDRGFWQDYHTFGFEWDENKMTFTCDGFPFSSHNAHQFAPDIDAFNNPYYLMLSMACGFSSRGGITNDPEEWANTNKLIVDYVNIYQKPGQELIYYKDGKEDKKIIIK